VSAFTDEALAGLVAQGRKVACPVCGRRVMSQGCMPFSQSGIGQHVRSAHPELEPEVLAASRRRERQIKTAQDAAAKEARERPLRQHTVTGAFLDETTSLLNSLIDMMEPYYSQSSGADEAYELIERIEAMHLAARGSE
jgi:uncharacterized Zn finger protein (UPF0148 family)